MTVLSVTKAAPRKDGADSIDGLLSLTERRGRPGDAPAEVPLPAGAAGNSPDQLPDRTRRLGVPLPSSASEAIGGIR